MDANSIHSKSSVPILIRDTTIVLEPEGTESFLRATLLKYATFLPCEIITKMTHLSILYARVGEGGGGTLYIQMKMGYEDCLGTTTDYERTKFDLCF